MDVRSRDEPGSGRHTHHRRCVNVAVARTLILEVGPSILRTSYPRLRSDHDDILSRASLRMLEARCLFVPPGFEEDDFVRGTATKRVRWLAREFSQAGARGEWGVGCDIVPAPVGGSADRVGVDQGDEDITAVALSDSAEDDALAVLHVVERLEHERECARRDAHAWAGASRESTPRLAWGKAWRRELFEAVFTERIATLAASAEERALWRRGDRRLVAWRGLALADPTTFGDHGPERPRKGTLAAAAEQDLYGAEPRLAARIVAALEGAFARHADPGDTGRRPLVKAA